MDPYLKKIWEDVELGQTDEYHLHIEGSIRFWGRWCVLKDDNMRNEIFTKAHGSPNTMHPGGTKMYLDLKQ